jgi:hypothetical protein
MTRDPNAQPPLQPPPLQPPPRGMIPPPPPPPVLGYRGPSGHGCPGCGGGPLVEPGFTWWGGLVGHKILGVEKCESCRHWWVKGTGQPGDTRVTIYKVVGIVLGLLFAVLYFFIEV